MSKGAGEMHDDSNNFFREETGQGTTNCDDEADVRNDMKQPRKQQNIRQTMQIQQKLLREHEFTGETMR
jgi:hypothetical protein